MRTGSRIGSWIRRICILQNDGDEVINCLLTHLTMTGTFDPFDRITSAEGPLASTNAETTHAFVQKEFVLGSANDPQTVEDLAST